MGRNHHRGRAWDFGPLVISHKRHEIMGVDSFGACSECGRSWTVFGESKEANRDVLRRRYRSHISRAKGEPDLHRKANGEYWDGQESVGRGAIRSAVDKWHYRDSAGI